jgi:predicted PurR-regulated permease PerM
MIRQKQQVPAGTEIAVIMIIILLSIVFLYYAKPVMLPITFSAVIALLLYPITRFLENNGFPRVPAIIITMFVVFCIGTGVILLLSTQIYRFVKDLPDLADKIDNMLNDVEWFLFKNFNIQVTSKGGLVQSSVTKFLDSGVVLLSGTISTFISIFNFLGLLPIYVFLMLLYRSSFKAFCLNVTPQTKHKTVLKILYEVQKVVQNYIIGLLTVMTIVAILTTGSLLIIGIDYAIFFGCFAAMLMVIPYLGMIIGALIPALYALVTKDSGLYALAVILSFGFIQFMEGNFITPKVTGNRVNINPLAAIIALVTGGYIWGMGGLVISLPIVAIVKVIVTNTPSLKHFGFLLGTEIYESNISMKRIFRRRRFKRRDIN